jgi:hypothetical protein
MRYQLVILGRDGLLNCEAPGPCHGYSARLDADRCSDTPAQGGGEGLTRALAHQDHLRGLYEDKDIEQ